MNTTYPECGQDDPCHLLLGRFTEDIGQDGNDIVSVNRRIEVYDHVDCLGDEYITREYYRSQQILEKAKVQSNICEINAYIKSKTSPGY